MLTPFVEKSFNKDMKPKVYFTKEITPESLTAKAGSPAGRAALADKL